MARFPQTILCALACASLSPAIAQPQALWLDTLDLTTVRQGWGAAQARRSVQGQPLRIAGATYQRGVGTHASSAWRLELPGGRLRLTAHVGVDDEMRGHPATVVFAVIGNGRELFRSGVMRVGTPASPVDVDLTGVRTLLLVVEDGGDGIDSDHADWADIRITGARSGIAPLRLLTSAPFDADFARPNWSVLHTDSCAGGGPMRMGRRTWPGGIGTISGADIAYTAMVANAARFRASLGLDDASPAAQGRCRVLLDGVVRWRSPLLLRGAEPVPVDIDLADSSEVRLIAEPPAGDGKPAWINWADARLTGARRGPATPRLSGGITVAGRRLAVQLSAEGRATSLRCFGKQIPIDAAMRMTGTLASAARRVPTVPGGAAFVEVRTDPITGRTCRVRQTFAPAGDGVRWRIEVMGTGAPWSTMIGTSLRWPARRTTRFWTAWADSRPTSHAGWSSPTEPAPFAARRLWYGGTPDRENLPPYLDLGTWDIFSLPMATVIEPQSDLGLTLACSPADDTIELRMTTSEDGTIRLDRFKNRISAARPVVFEMALVPHEADWRPGAAWIARRWPAWFEPANPRAHQIAGLGAYTTHQGELEVDRLRAMGFRTNWQASYEFPYMGMFLPPVQPGENWTSFRHESTSFERNEDYYSRMERMGFHVLSYFNVTEFGAGIHARTEADIQPNGPDLWRDANAMLWTCLAGAVLPGVDGKPIWTWEGGVGMDPGEPVYRDFLVEQARRHLEHTPSSAGFCIDRLDWLHNVNRTRDDGRTWSEDRPARALLYSWRDVISRLAPEVHAAGKVIFVNTITRRLDLLRDVDGIYDEIATHPGGFNAASLLGLRRPVMAWTGSESELRPDADAYFQRFLHMGAFPTAPLPANDHTIQPSPWTDRQYARYGPLFRALFARTWNLAPHAIRVTATGALANAFRTPAGAIAVVTFAGAARRTHITLRGAPEAFSRAEALLPGASTPTPISAVRRGGRVEIDTPVASGCAVVRLVPR